MRHPMNSVSCSGCQKEMSPSDGCPKRIEICKDCRQIPKKLRRARQKMDLHLVEHHRAEVAKLREQFKAGLRRRSKPVAVPVEA